MEMSSGRYSTSSVSHLRVARAPGGTWDGNALKSPPPQGYPTLPPNWESLNQLTATKPKFQTVVHQFMAMVWGGVTDDPAKNNQTDFSIVPYLQAPGKTYTPPFGIGTAPFYYWQRSLDSYTQILQLLDQSIGNVIASMHPDVAKNTMIMFTSDHGDYAGAHGFVSGKTGSFYDEAVQYRSSSSTQLDVSPATSMSFETILRHRWTFCGSSSVSATTAVNHG